MYNSFTFILHPSYIYHYEFKRLIQIPLDIFDIFETNAQADKIGADTSGNLIFSVKLAVCGCGGMNGKTARIANVGKVAEELQAFDEFLACFHAAFDAKAEDRACAFGEIFLGACIIGVTLQSGIFDPTDFGMLLKIFGNGLRVLHVTFHAQAEGFNALNGLP